MKESTDKLRYIDNNKNRLDLIYFFISVLGFSIFKNTQSSLDNVINGTREH